MILRPMYPLEAPERDLHAMHRFTRRIALEREPDDPPLGYEHFITNIQNVPEYVDVTFWAVWDDAGENVLARITLVVPRMEGDEHTMSFVLVVAPEIRRRGIGTRLMRLAADRAGEMNRRLLTATSFSTMPAGEAFLRHIGATPAISGHTNELRLSEVDRGLLQSWIAQARERAPEFELGFWLDGYPDERLNEITAIQDAWNTQPMGELEVGETHFTPEQIRAQEAMLKARGDTRWTCYVQERDTGTIAGFTEIAISIHEPSRIQQELTAVFPPYRGKGLGKWLKAAMMERILDELPEAEIVTTGNADVNEPMLRINRAMGFRPTDAHAIWQIELERLLEHLRERGVPVAEELFSS